MPEKKTIEQLKADIILQKERTQSEQFERVLSLVKVLRQECPWDRKQTAQSLAHLLLEESYELVHAIDQQNEVELKKELGDLFLHLCFQVMLGEEHGKFSFADVFEALCQKLINRHPHIFDDISVDRKRNVLKNWEHLKLKEGRQSLLDGVPNAMSELLRAYRVQKKVSNIGFDWSSCENVLDKLAEDIEKLKKIANKEAQEEEFGNLLFIIVNYSRFIGVNPEDSLRKATNKFMVQFRMMEQKVQESGLGWEKYTSAELDVLWQQTKK
ncbi:MAG: nucleoside triphosphate pyrophosphohydrolase [Chlorobiaceae bacterium]